jgi:UPF0755 protein
MGTLSDALDAALFGLRLHLSGAWKLYAAWIVALALVFGGLWHAFIAPPAAFPLGITEVPSGEPLSAIARQLAAARVIRSPFALKAILYATGQERHIQAGPYDFKAPESALAVARRIASGDAQIAPIRVTLTEGMASFDMARTLAAAVPGFDAATFQRLAAAREGYLFPDTYFFLPTATPQEVVDRLSANFDAKIAEAQPLIAASGRSEADIITMASIVEREAQTPEDRRIVAGILWHRISLGMRLQVDAPFGYLHQDDGYTPTSADTESASPYNTYRNAGLPPTPIANPGLDAIEAAADPTQTDYLYYITGSDGQMHYAKTFEEHKANVAKYL